MWHVKAMQFVSLVVCFVDKLLWEILYENKS